MDNELEHRLAAIEERNLRVEGDKAWEGSFVRRALIAALTYVVVALYNWAIGGHVPLLTAFVPVGGYLFSTLTIPAIKKRWIAQFQTGEGKPTRNSLRRCECRDQNQQSV